MEISKAVKSYKRKEGYCMLDRLQKIKHRLSVKGRGYDLTKDVEVTDLFDDFEWLIDSLEVVIKARDGHFKEIERLQNVIRHVADELNNEYERLKALCED